MPIYTYECRACFHRVEEIAPLNHRQTVCPVCGAVAEKVPSLTASRRDMTIHGESR